MLKKALFTLLCASALSAYAEPRDFGIAVLPEAPKQFNESQIDLPEFPDVEQGQWLELYISPTYKGQARILLDSIQVAEDGSVRYVFNNRSSSGYDNVTAEGLLCVGGLLNSDGAKLKTFAYGDTSTKRWIMPRRSDWQVIGGKRNAVDPVRSTLYEAFCVEHKLKTADNFRKTLMQKYSKNIK